MCRYADPRCKYKDRYVCLQCLSAHKGERKDCQYCKGPIHYVGKDYRTPRKLDDKGWKILTKLIEAKFTFGSCGCTGIGSIPKTLRNVNRLVDKKKVRC